VAAERARQRAASGAARAVLAELLVVATGVAINLATNALPQSWAWARDLRYVGAAFLLLVVLTVLAAWFWAHQPPATAADSQGSNANVEALSGLEIATSGTRANLLVRNWKTWVSISCGLAILSVVLVVGHVANGNGDAHPTSASPATPFSSESDSTTKSTKNANPPNLASTPRTYNGNGDDVVSITKDIGVAVVRFQCPMCTGNTIVTTDGGQYLIVNTVGSYSGERLIDTADGSSTSTLTIKASAQWSVTVGSERSLAREATIGAPLPGKGDDVLLVDDTTRKAHVTNQGGTNFVVKVLPIGDSGQFDLAINAVGNYVGNVPASGPAIIEITSSGQWTITLS